MNTGINKLLRFSRTIIVSYLSWMVGSILFVLILFSVIYYLPDTVSAQEYTSNIALLTQVLSVLIGFSFVGTTLHLSGYSVSEHVSSLLDELSEIARKLQDGFLDGPPTRCKATNASYIKWLFSSFKIERLRFSDKNNKDKNFYIFRPYWDGVWYQVYSSPFEENEKNEKQLTIIARLHEVAICSAKIMGIISELRKNEINLLSHNKGTQGTRWFIKSFEAITKDFPTLKEGIAPDQMRTTDAIKLTNLAFHSEHYIFEEMSKYSEEVNWDPYNLTYFEVILSEYILWMGYLIQHLQHLRLTKAEFSSEGLIEKFSKKTNKSIGLKKLHKIKLQTLDARKKAISAFGVNKRYKDMRNASIPGIGVGILALLLIVLIWPAQLGLSNSTDIKYLFAILFGIGIVGIIHCGFFIVQLLLGGIRNQSRSPMGTHG